MAMDTWDSWAAGESDPTNTDWDINRPPPPPPEIRGTPGDRWMGDLGVMDEYTKKRQAYEKQQKEEGIGTDVGSIFEPDPHAFDYTSGFGPEDYYSKQMEHSRRIGSKSPYIRDARGLQRDARGGMQQALGLMGARARGDYSVVDQAAQAEREAGQAAIQSQLSSMRGGYSPAAQRAAMYGLSGMTQGMAGDVATRKAQERQAAEQAWLSGLGGMRGQDLGLMGQEAGIEKQRLAHEAAKEKLAQGWAGIGVGEKQFGTGAKISEQAMKFGAHEGGKGRTLGWETTKYGGDLAERLLKMKMAHEKSMQPGLGSKIVGGLMGAIPAGLSLYGQLSTNKAKSGGTGTAGDDWPDF